MRFAQVGPFAPGPPWLIHKILIYIFAVPFGATWLTAVGLIFFFLNITLFLINCVMIALRFHWRPGSFISSFTDQVESLFIPAFVS